jgi:hypothetical protein
LVCEGKWDENDVAKLIACHSRRRRDCPRLFGMLLQKA